MPQSQPQLPDEDPGLVFGWQIGFDVDEVFGLSRDSLPQLTPPENPVGPPILDTGDNSRLDAFFDLINSNAMPPLNYGEGLASLHTEPWLAGGEIPGVLVGTSTTLGPQTDPTLSSPALEMPNMNFPTGSSMMDGASQSTHFTPVSQPTGQTHQHRHHHHHHHHHRPSHAVPAPAPLPSPSRHLIHQTHSDQEIAAATALQNTALFQNRTGRQDYTSYTGSPASAGGIYGQSQQSHLAGQNNQQSVFATPHGNAAIQPFGFSIAANQHTPQAQEQPQVSASLFEPSVYMHGHAHAHVQPQRQAGLPTAEPTVLAQLRNPQWGSDPSFNRPNGYVPPTTQEDSAQIEQERLRYVSDCLEPVLASSNETSGPTTPNSPAGRQTRLDRLLSEYDKANATVTVKVESEEGPEQKHASVEGNKYEDESRPSNSKGKAKAKPQARARVPKRLNTTAATIGKSPSSEPVADSQAPEASPGLGEDEDDDDSTGRPSTGKRRKSSIAAPKAPRVNLTLEQKRLNHINSEKRRRGNIKDQLQDLQSEIEPIKDQKMSKGVVAEKTFEFIEALLHDNNYLLELSMQHGWSEDSVADDGDGESQQNHGARGSNPSLDAGYQSVMPPPSEPTFGTSSRQNGHLDHQLHNGVQPVQQQNGIHQAGMGVPEVHLNGLGGHTAAATTGANDLSTQQNGGYDGYAAASQDVGAGTSAQPHHQQIFHSPTMFGQWHGAGGQMPTSPHSLFG